MNIDFTDMTDDDIFTMQSLLNAEKRRRKDEPKLPVYCTGGCTYKKIVPALLALQKEIDIALGFECGAKNYYNEAIANGEKAELLSLKIEFWSESEYNIRPDVVWG